MSGACIIGTGLTGLEPATSALTGQRSNQLSYNPPLPGLYYVHIKVRLSNKMSNLSEQVAKLIETGPQQGIPPIAIAPIARMLATVAKDLEHLQYFALRDRQQGWWLISTGGEGDESKETERWVAAFGHRADAERMLAELARVAEGSDASGFEVVEKDTIQLLFFSPGVAAQCWVAAVRSRGGRRQNRARVANFGTGNPGGGFESGDAEVFGRAEASGNRLNDGLNAD